MAPGELHPKKAEEVTRSYWEVAHVLPWFADSRGFIERWVYVGEDAPFLKGELS